jgi:hypothetical protein
MFFQLKVMFMATEKKGVTELSIIWRMKLTTVNVASSAKMGSCVAMC